MGFIDAHLVQIDGLTNTRRARSTSNAICCVVEGAGETQVGGETISWRERNIFTLPQGNWITHKASSKSARLFVVSDRDLMRLGLLLDEYEDGRTERSTAAKPPGAPGAMG
jgi:gentisate 1,2-dioxygenase